MMEGYTYKLICPTHPEASVKVICRRAEYPHFYPLTTIECSLCGEELASHDHEDFHLKAGAFVNHVR